MKFLTIDLKVQVSDIFIFGRSIGSGPACELAAKYKPKALILMAPFKSLKTVANELVPFLGTLASFLLKDRFINIE